MKSKIYFKISDQFSKNDLDLVKSIPKIVNTYLSKNSLKIIGNYRIQICLDNDDFVQARSTVLITFNQFKVPRIINYVQRQQNNSARSSSSRNRGYSRSNSQKRTTSHTRR